MTYQPIWKGPIEGYVTNQLQKIMWRVASTMDRDDVLQEAYIVFLRCSTKYPDMDTPQHFMALFKTAWSRRVHELANKDTAAGVGQCEDEHAEQDRELIGELDNVGIVHTLIRQAPREVMMVLTLFLSAPAELLGLAEQAFCDSKRGKAKLDQNAMVRRLLGPEVGERPVDAVRAYFLGD